MYVLWFNILKEKKKEEYDALIFENHGVLTVGSSIELACNLNTLVEEDPKIQYIVMTLVGRNVFSLDQLKKKVKKQNP